MSRRQIERGRAFDRKARERHIKKTNREKGSLRRNWIYEAWLALKRRWTS